MPVAIGFKGTNILMNAPPTPTPLSMGRTGNHNFYCLWVAKVMLVHVKWEKYDNGSRLELPALISRDFQLLIYFAIFITTINLEKPRLFLKVRANCLIVYQGFEWKTERRQTKVLSLIPDPPLKHEVSIQPYLPSLSTPYDPTVFICKWNVFLVKCHDAVLCNLFFF